MHLIAKNEQSAAKILGALENVDREKRGSSTTNVNNL